MALSNKDPAETVTVTFDFSALTPSPAAPAVSVLQVGGTQDANPAALLLGSPVIMGAKVLQQITGGLDGATYDLRCEATATDGSVYVLSGWLAVQST
jgi:hypothetical protein